MKSLENLEYSRILNRSPKRQASNQAIHIRYFNTEIQTGFGLQTLQKFESNILCIQKNN